MDIHFIEENINGSIERWITATCDMWLWEVLFC